MYSVILSTENKSDFKLLVAIAKRLGMKVKVLTPAEIELFNLDKKRTKKINKKPI